MSLILDADNTSVALSEQAQGVLFEVAKNLGLLVTMEESAALGALMDLQGALSEQKNIVRLNRQAQLDSLTVRAALVLAQQHKDPLFARYAKAAKLRRQFRAQILKKYSGKAHTTARHLLANAGHKNLVEPKQSAALHPEEHLHGRK